MLLHVVVCIASFFMHWSSCVSASPVRRAVLSCITSWYTCIVFNIVARNNWPDFTPHTSIVQHTSWWRSSEIHMCYAKRCAMFLLSFFFSLLYRIGPSDGCEHILHAIRSVKLTNTSECAKYRYFIPFHCVDVFFYFLSIVSWILS